ncbi:MAG: stage II sporulation protein P [Clostridia bacterium]
MNVAIINLKGISKSFIKLIISIIFLSLLIKFLISNVKNLQKVFSFETCSSVYTGFFYNINEEKYEVDSLEILKTVSPLVMALDEENEIAPEIEEILKEENDIIIFKNATIEAVSEKNIEENFNFTTGTTKIRNQSDYELTEDILSLEDFNLTNTKKILIYHTHTCESYTPSEQYNYTMTGNYRTTDNNYNVVRVGEELSKFLTNKGFEVIHDSSYHDYPSYSGSYERSLETIQEILNENQDIQIVIDLHRDAVGDGSSYGPTVKIDGQSVAQMMLVVGTDGGGLEHPNWRQNIKTAIKIQETANLLYPGLFRPIIVRNSRYNQHVTPGAFIIEVGATGNTLEECLLSMQCLANIIEEAF